jgi:hypothetical protein
MLDDERIAHCQQPPVPPRLSADAKLVRYVPRRAKEANKVATRENESFMFLEWEKKMRTA